MDAEWTKEPPKEAGWYWIRWEWWRPGWSEAAHVYQDEEDGSWWASRVGHQDLKLPYKQHGKPMLFWPIAIPPPPEVKRG